MVGVWYNPATGKIEADWRDKPMESVKVADLRHSLRYRQPITLRGITGIVQMIEREDGSGKSFNVRLYITDRLPPGTTNVATIWVKTVDVEQRAAA